VKRLLDYDPLTGVKTMFEHNDLTDESIISYEADAEPNLEHAKSLANDDDYTRQGMKHSTVHYAHIPAVLLLKWHAEGVNIKDNQELFKKVNSREFRYLKTTNIVHR